MNAQLLKLECLTPVHIGSGAELIRSIDFYADGGFTEVLDPDLLLESAGAMEGFAEAIRRENGIAGFLRGRGLNASMFRLHRVAGTIESQRLRLAIRAGDGRPMIPGSSLKGALRTLLLAAWSGEGGPHAGARTPAVRQALGSIMTGRPSARVLEEALFHFRHERIRSGDPKTDIARVITVSDAMFAPASLKVVSSKAVGTTRPTLTAAEALDRGASALLTLKMGDEFLSRRLPFPNAIPDLATLAAWSRAHTRHLIGGDITFFKNNREERMVERLAALLDEVEQFPAAAITLRLGWGTGWRTMTGDILTPEERDRVIRVGKTRKVIIDGHAARGAACDVFGWVRIEPISGAEAAVVARATRPATVQPPKLAAPQPPVQASAAAPMGLPPRDAFAQRLQGLKSRDWGLVAGLVKEAASHTDPAERERRLRLLADQFTATFGGDRKRMRQLAEMAEIAPYLKRK